MSFDGLVELFKDENYLDIERHISINLEECSTKRDKIDMASALLLGNLRKLNLGDKGKRGQSDEKDSKRGSNRSSLVNNSLKVKKYNTPKSFLKRRSKLNYEALMMNQRKLSKMAGIN